MEFEFTSQFKDSSWEHCELQLAAEAWMYACRRPEGYEGHKAHGHPWGWIYIHSSKLSSRSVSTLETHRFEERDPLAHHAVMLAMVEKYRGGL